MDISAQSNLLAMNAAIEAAQIETLDKAIVPYTA
jgi:hypothetical protein